MFNQLILAFGHALALCGGFLAAGVTSASLARLNLSVESRCAIVNTTCWSSSLNAYNDATEQMGAHSDEACHLSELMNFVWCNEYGGDHQPIFTNHGQMGYLDAHLTSIYEIASRPKINTIIYMNAPGCLGSFVREKEILEADKVLERIRSDYPETAPDVEAYSAALHRSLGYREMQATYTLNLKKRFQTEGPGAFARGIAAIAGYYRHEAKQVIRRMLIPLQRFFITVARIRDILEEQPARRECRHHGLSPAFGNGARIVSLLDACAGTYADASNDKPFRPMMPRGDFWKACGGEEVWMAWVRLAATMCKSRGITLIYYIPPHLNVTEKEYRKTFGPAYVERVRRAFAPYSNVVVIDHSMNRELGPHDALWIELQNQCFKQGYLFHIIGRLKLARALIRVLREHKAIPSDDECRYAGSAWPGERSLPSLLSAVEFLPSGLVLDEIQREEIVSRSKPAQIP
jgi:hypothetical protein